MSPTDSNNEQMVGEVRNRYGKIAAGEISGCGCGCGVGTGCETEVAVGIGYGADELA